MNFAVFDIKFFILNNTMAEIIGIRPHFQSSFYLKDLHAYSTLSYFLWSCVWEGVDFLTYQADAKVMTLGIYFEFWNFLGFSIITFFSLYLTILL